MNNTTASVTDFGQFAQLRAAAREQNPEALKAAAKQFEALFMQQMLKSMRAASLGEDIMGSEQTEFYQDMFDQQLAVHLSAGKGLGIADVLVRQLQQAQGMPTDAKPTAQPSLKAAEQSPLPARSAENLPTSIRTGGVSTARYRDLSLGLPDSAQNISEAQPLSPKAAFIAQLRPHAEKAAQALGIEPETLLAQAALETGWGKHLIQKSDGTPALNFFGIKADKGWNGERAQSATTEFMNGQKTTETAQFRAYDSIEESFADYVRFIQQNPRYRDALQHQGNDAHYTRGLQKAGYATDPEYASKIQTLSSSGPIQASASRGRLSL